MSTYTDPNLHPSQPDPRAVPHYHPEYQGGGVGAYPQAGPQPYPYPPPMLPQQYQAAPYIPGAYSVPPHPYPLNGYPVTPPIYTVPPHGHPTDGYPGGPYNVYHAVPQMPPNWPQPVNVEPRVGNQRPAYIPPIYEDEQVRLQRELNNRRKAHSDNELGTDAHGAKGDRPARPPVRPMPAHYYDDDEESALVNSMEVSPESRGRSGEGGGREERRGGGNQYERASGGHSSFLSEEERRMLSLSLLDRGSSPDDHSRMESRLYESSYDDRSNSHCARYSPPVGNGGGRGYGEEQGGGGDRHYGAARGHGHGRDERGGSGQQYRDEGNAQESFGPPMRARTPINGTTHEDQWKFLGRLNDAKKRVRWQIINILKIARDKNYMAVAGKRNAEFEIVDVKSLGDLVQMGCGDDMELYEATKEYPPEKNSFLEFLKDMEKDRLLRLLIQGRQTDDPEHIFAIDPYTKAPANFTNFDG